MNENGTTREGGEQRRRSRREVEVLRRDVHVHDVMTSLRARLGLRPPGQLVPGEEAALLGELPTRPTAVVDIDCAAWLTWTRAGLSLFSTERTPSIRRVVSEAWRIMLALAMVRHGGNITQIAATLGTCRRVSRERLKAVGLYIERPPGSFKNSACGTMHGDTRPEGSTDAT